MQGLHQLVWLWIELVYRSIFIKECHVWSIKNSRGTSTINKKKMLNNFFSKTLNEDDLKSELWKNDETKKCPNCYANIQKNGGCNHMSCKVVRIFSYEPHSVLEVQFRLLLELSWSVFKKSQLFKTKTASSPSNNKSNSTCHNPEYPISNEKATQPVNSGNCK